jgi:hypothetical protein
MTMNTPHYYAIRIEPRDGTAVSKHSVLLTGYDGTELIIYAHHVVALSVDPNSAGTMVWLGAGADDSFYVRESLHDVARLIDDSLAGCAEVAR